jgi:hypothetical protein
MANGVFQQIEIEFVLGTPIDFFVYPTKVFSLIRTDVPQYGEAKALASVTLIVIMKPQASSAFLSSLSPSWARLWFAIWAYASPCVTISPRRGVLRDRLVPLVEGKTETRATDFSGIVPMTCD